MRCAPDAIQAHGIFLLKSAQAILEMKLVSFL